ncbi:competence type IV pilus assembly protein ComGB [Streptococcus halichoeri]|nr:competence type IV pilus assembly protein ComGB [Streptococcus halichoeri]
MKKVLFQKINIKPKRLTAKEQYQLLQLLRNLYASGFSLPEMVQFLDKSRLVAPAFVRIMYEDLEAGHSLAQMLEHLGYKEGLVTQMSLAGVHGNIHLCLEKMVAYLKQVQVVKRQLLSVMTYPLILLLFLLVIMVAMKHYLIPQLEHQSRLMTLVSHFPTLFLLSAVGLAFVGLILTYFWKRGKRLTWLTGLSRWPLLGSFIRLYLTAFYAREWGHLIGQGLELATILQVLGQEQSPLMRELSLDLQAALESGQAFHEKVATYPFFRKELALMIEYGEVKAKLGQELEIYAQETWQHFFSKCHQATQWIQPLIFLGVALIIVLVYAALLLPMYETMGGII